MGVGRAICRVVQRSWASLARRERGEAAVDPEGDINGPTAASPVPDQQDVSDIMDCSAEVKNIEGQFWCSETVEGGRPACCPRCHVLTYCDGRLGVHGHGTRQRGSEGPLAPDGAPVSTLHRVRRYRCTRCRHVMTVLPAGVLRYRQYVAGAIGMLICLWTMGETAAALRAAHSAARVVGPCSARDWPMLRRWVRWAAGRLGLADATASVAAQAEALRRHIEGQAAATLEAESLAVRAFDGAMRCLG